MNRIEIERTLIVGNAMLSVGTQAYMRLKSRWIYGKILWISESQVGVCDLADDDYSYILYPYDILQISDKMPSHLKKYEVTITRTGSIIVEAENEKEAFDKVLSMTNKEIEEESNLTSWEPSDVEEIGE